MRQFEQIGRYLSIRNRTRCAGHATAAGVSAKFTEGTILPTQHPRCGDGRSAATPARFKADRPTVRAAVSSE